MAPSPSSGTKITMAGPGWAGMRDEKMKSKKITVHASKCSHLFRERQSLLQLLEILLRVRTYLGFRASGYKISSNGAPVPAKVVHAQNKTLVLFLSPPTFDFFADDDGGKGGRLSAWLNLNR